MAEKKLPHIFCRWYNKWEEIQVRIRPECSAVLNCCSPRFLEWRCYHRLVAALPRIQVQQSSLLLCFFSSSGLTSIRRPLSPVKSFPLFANRIQSIRLCPGFNTTFNPRRNDPWQWTLPQNNHLTAHIAENFRDPYLVSPGAGRLGRADPLLRAGGRERLGRDVQHGAYTAEAARAFHRTCGTSGTSQWRNIWLC